MSRSIHSITVATFLLATAVILAISVMWYRSTGNLVQTNRLVGHTREVLRNLEGVRAAMEDATAAVRNLLTTGDETNVQAYVAATGRYRGGLHRLRELTAENPRQQQQIATLERAIEERLARAQEDIERRKQQSALPDADRRPGVGTGGSQAIRDQIAEMAKEAEELLQHRTSAVEVASQRMSALNLVFPLLALTFLSVFFYRIQRDFTARKEAENALRESAERHRLLFDSSPVPIWVTDRESLQFLAVNNAAVRHYGYAREEFLAMTVKNILPPEEIPAVIERLSRITPGTEMSTKTRHRKKDGAMMEVETNLFSLVFAGRPAVLVLVKDVTERLRAEAALQQAHEQLSASVGALQQREKDITQLSEMTNLLQSCQTPEEAYAILSQSMIRLFPEIGGAIYMISSSRNLVEAVAAWGGAGLAGSVFAPRDCWALRRGRAHLFERHDSAPPCAHRSQAEPAGYLCIPMMAQSEAMGVLHLAAGTPEQADSVIPAGRFSPPQQRLAAAAAEQIALALANLKLRETLRNQSIRDPLTNLFNRRYMEESSERELRRAARKQTPLGIIMLDVDHFKQFNDGFGHDAGDEMLRLVARLLQSSIRAEDIACRYGGEEFVLVLPDSSLEDARRRAEQLREATRQIQLQLHGQAAAGISLSLGVAAFPIHGCTVEALLRVADLALYRAKHEGRDRVAVGQGMETQQA